MFQAPAHDRFPALNLAIESMRSGGLAPTVLNAANEVAVAAFLDGGIQFPDISRLVEMALQENQRPGPQSIEDVFEIDREVRTEVS